MNISGIKFFEGTGIQRFTDTFHQRVVEIQVVHHAQAHGQHLVSFKQMTDIGAGMETAGILSNKTV